MQKSAVLMFLCLLIPSIHAQSLPEGLAKNAIRAVAETCEGVADLNDCHGDYPAGCTKSETPRYDAYLSYLKNQLPPPNLPPEEQLPPSEFKNLDRDTPETLSKGNHSQHSAELLALGEGRIYELVGYLYYATVNAGEACNCQLTGQQNSDFHIGIGFDTDVAGRITARSPMTRAMRQTSIVVEMTPHYRAEYHPDWTIQRLRRARGKQVKVIGQLIIDKEHIHGNENCGHPNIDAHQAKNCWPASAWELHPVIQFLVCEITFCTPNSRSWVELGSASGLVASKNVRPRAAAQ